jgi:site-specific recombinase XerD
MLGVMETPFSYFFNERIDPRTFAALTDAPLAGSLRAYAQWLHDQGYALQTSQLQLRLLGHFNGWLKRKGLRTDQIDGATVERYVRYRRKAGKLRRGDAAALMRLLGMLRPGQAAKASLPPPSACQTVLQQFQHALRQERGLAEATIKRQTPVVRAFLAEHLRTDSADFRHLSPSDITGFVQRQAERITTKSAPTVVTALRAFLRYLLHRGAIDHDLAACVPTIETWSASGVPKFLPAEQIQRVLDRCDRHTALGKRDYAVLLLLARLGLRAGEVVALTLEDLDWEAGLITVRGKGKRFA